MSKKIISKLLALTFLFGCLGFFLNMPNSQVSAAARCCVSDAECAPLGKVCRVCKCVIPPLPPDWRK
jgi:hypothetical protein